MHRILPQIKKTQSILAIIGLILILFGYSMPIKAAKNVPVHAQDCSAQFPCPPALSRRVDFWIEVFSEWDKNTAVLHDANSPWRVYATYKTKNSCSDPNIKKQRKRLSGNLTALAKRLKKDLAPKGRIQQQLAEQFDTLNSKTVFKAAKSLRCQLGVKDQYVAALSRFEKYRPLIERVIAETNMPKDLLYLPFVESSYRPNAYSKVGAAGMWQIMPKTARSLGMELNAVLDERLDPEAATRGAMRYFKNSQKSLIPLAKEIQPNITQPEINPFIITSYNYGVSGMRRAMKQVGPDFPKVLSEYKSAAFQVAVKNFYASFLAARHLARNSKKYFGDVKPAARVDYQTFVLPSATSIDRIKHQFNLNEQQLKSLNPALTRFAWNNWRLIPAGYRMHLPYRKHRWIAQIDKLNALQPEPQSLNKQVYRVRRGDTACSIANAFKVNCKTLIAANQLGRKAVIRIGQKLDIPGKRIAGKRVVKAAVKTQTSGIYTVQSGDTACRVAKRHGVACKELIRLNKLGRQAKIRVGQAIKIPGLIASKQVSKAVPVALNYTVKKGDTACEIAQRYAISCDRFRTANNLSRKATIRVGQVLVINDRLNSASTNVVVTKYKVRRGDTTCEIAERFDIPCASLIKANRLGQRGKIRAGQELKITSIVGPQTSDPDLSTEQQTWLTTVDTLPDLSLKVIEGGMTLSVLPNETLAHYSDWMGAWSSSAKVRALNKVSKNDALPLGKTIKLPITLDKTKKRFLSKRAEFHQVLTEQFKERFVISRVKSVKLKSGQSLWSIAKTNDAPLWLLMRFNTDLGRNIHPGQTILVPVVKNR